MAEAFFPTKDGHVGNLKKIITPRLQEMIQRQEKLLQKKAFLKTLADKGEKIHQHLQVLKQELESRTQDTLKNSNVSSGDSQVSSVKLTAVNDSAASVKLPAVNDNAANVKLPTVNDNAASIIHLDQSSHRDGQDNADTVVDNSRVAESLEVDFEKLRVTVNDVGSVLPRTKHQFEIAEERSEQNLKEKKLPKRLNQALHISNVEDLPSELRHGDVTIADQRIRDKKTTQVEESAATPPRYKYAEVKIVGLEESLKLQTSQRQKQEELQAQLATEKLAERLNIKLETYNPEGVDMSYRGTKTVNGDLDSDDDIDEEGQGVTGMKDILDSDTED